MTSLDGLDQRCRRPAVGRQQVATAASHGMGDRHLLAEIGLSRPKDVEKEQSELTFSCRRSWVNELHACEVCCGGTVSQIHDLTSV